MGAKTKLAKSKGSARAHSAKTPASRGRKSRTVSEAWEQTAQVPDERDDELDLQRIVQGEGGRSLPRYFDDYN
jgi:hypothetical protein